MACLPLGNEEITELKKELRDFVRRVSDYYGEKRPEEIAILPAMIKILLGQDS